MEGGLGECPKIMRAVMVSRTVLKRESVAVSEWRADLLST